MKAIRPDILARIKDFLEEILPQIPNNNLLKFHFNNVLLLLSVYETVLNTKFPHFMYNQEPKALPVMFQNPFKGFESTHSFSEDEEFDESLSEEDEEGLSE